jgi:NAD-dependent dihydropyrimidine dehydrogenase PreA subunit/bacterioferritin-associated ferredoxin
MFNITKKAVVDPDKCNGCKTCYRVCPTFAIEMELKKAVIDDDKCLGCTNCFQRCPEYAITMEVLDEPIAIGVDAGKFDQEKIWEICLKAHFTPDMIICICNNTLAGEVAASILDGAKSPADVTLKTGVGVGCKVACPQPVYRMLQAAGIEPHKPDGYQWCGPTITQWALSSEVIEKYGSRYYFEEDRKLADDAVADRLKRRKGNV